MPARVPWWEQPQPAPKPAAPRPTYLNLSRLAALDPDQKRAQWARIKSHYPAHVAYIRRAAPALQNDPVVQAIAERFGGEILLELTEPDK